MKLSQKGQSAALSSLHSLICTMTWTTKADFDLGALLELKDGTVDLRYFGEHGDLNVSPYIALDHDAGIGDTEDDGGNEENLRIADLKAVNKVHLFCWDYGQVQKGNPARFDDSDVKLTIMDNNSESHDVHLDCGDTGNVIYLAMIDNSNPVDAKFVNTSKVATWKGIHDSKQFEDMVK